MKPLAFEIKSRSLTESEKRIAGFPRRPGVKPPAPLRCCICGQFVSRNDFAFDIEGIEDGLICARCNVDFDSWDDPNL